MSEVKKVKKEELVALAKKNGLFKKPAVKSVWGRENGHFYYNKPPAFADGLESFEITREDVEGKTSEKLSAKDAVLAIEACKTEDELKALYADGKIIEGKESSTVITALENKKQELSS